MKKKGKKMRALIKPRNFLIPTLRMKGMPVFKNKKKQFLKDLCRKEINSEM
jgi:hypothetical protein